MTIGVWDEVAAFMLAIVVFLATLKFINMLKFNRRMGMLTDTIRLAAKDMKAFVITFFIYFFAFAQLAYLLFGSQHRCVGESDLQVCQSTYYRCKQFICCSAASTGVSVSDLQVCQSTYYKCIPAVRQPAQVCQ